MEKVLLCVIGRFLCHISVRDVFVQNEIYGLFADLMTGSNYRLSWQAFRILHEAVSCLRFAKFEQEQQPYQIYSLFSKIIQFIKYSFKQTCEYEEIKNY